MAENKVAGSGESPTQQKRHVDIIREGEDNILIIDFSDYTRLPLVEDDPLVMHQVCDILVENANITKVVLKQKQDYEYGYAQTSLLSELVNYYKHLVRSKDLYEYSALVNVAINQKELSQRYMELKNIIFNTMKNDPIGTYVQLKRIERKTMIEFQKLIVPEEKEVVAKYIDVIQNIIKGFEELKLIILAKPYIEGHHIGDREVYAKLFSPIIKPDFMYTRLMSAYPKGGEEIDNYKIGNTEYVIFRLQNSVQYLYHVTPPEFKLTEEKYELLTTARNIMAEHKPDRQEFVDPKRMREVFFNVGYDLIEELAEHRSLRMNDKELKELTEILVRYTVGFGLIEILLADPAIQDVTINSPLGKTPMFIVHGQHGDCVTNIYPSHIEAESWASKLRMISGRPLDESNPILDTEIEIPDIAKARVGVISVPLDPTGLAFAFRRHRDKPWTLALFIEKKMINAMAAGILSFIIDGSRTLLVAGTRSAGKSSLLGGIMVELMRRYRIITIEDTLELPSGSLRDLGFNIQQMKVASAFTKGSNEIGAEEGIRTTLRLGDSCLIVGEVRSTEARALYEAMRVGALANIVAGTIHGDSPYGVYDRVVNDLNVPKTSFKATDIIIVANPVKSPDGLSRRRRVTQITEVRKKWENDPMLENGFVDLMKYNPITDELEPTDELINGDSEVLKAIAGNVKEWAGDWDAMWDNVMLRSKIKERQVKAVKDEEDEELLEAEFSIKCNDAFHNISAKVLEGYGSLDSERIYFEWEEWLRKELRMRKMR